MSTRDHSTAYEGLRVQLASSGPVRLEAEFDCAPGELIALVGGSGSGKTTLLRCIAGLHQSADLQGRITVSGKTWLNTSRQIALPPQARCVGLVFQQYALFPHLSAINNIALCAYSITANGLFDSKKQAFKWLERFGLAELAERPIHVLSGGQQQRVALARALVRIEGQNREAGGSPGVLLLDEPFSAVDAPMRQVLYRELAQLRTQLQVPIVLVTHDLNEARRLASRIVIIDGGETLQSGSPAQVLRSPRNARVAHLVGIHNHFHARFRKKSDGLAELLWGTAADAPRLLVRDKGKIDDDSAVTWVLAGESVQLLPAAAIADPNSNLLIATLTEALPLGEISLCRFAVQGTPDSIQLNLPTATLQAQQWHIGLALKLAIARDAVHIMPLKPVATKLSIHSSQGQSHDRPMD
jgi:molybdate transport system ATP-binding protein